jgi:hypothetical protein
METKRGNGMETIEDFGDILVMILAGFGALLAFVQIVL